MENLPDLIELPPKARLGFSGAPINAVPIQANNNNVEVDVIAGR